MAGLDIIENNLLTIDGNSINIQNNFTVDNLGNLRYKVDE